MPAGGLATAAVLGIAEAGIGLINKGKANKKAAQLAASRPKLGPSEYLKDQLSLSESELSNGMSAGAKTAYEEGLDKDLSSSLGAVTRMGGSPNDVGSVFANNATGRQRLAIMKDNLRLTQINNLTRSQDANEEYSEKQFQFNQWAPWADSAQANAQDKANAQSEIFSGVNTAAGGAMRFGQQQNQKKLFNNYFNQKNGAGAGAATGGGGNYDAVQEPAAAASSTPTLDNLLGDDFYG